MVTNTINCQCIYNCRNNMTTISKRVKKAIEDTQRVAEEAKSIKINTMHSNPTTSWTTTTGSSTRLSTHIAQIIR